MSKNEKDGVDIDYRHYQSSIFEAGEAASDIIEASSESVPISDDGKGIEHIQREALYKHPVLVAVHALITCLEKINHERLVREGDEEKRRRDEIRMLTIAVESIANILNRR